MNFKKNKIVQTWLGIFFIILGVDGWPAILSFETTRQVVPGVTHIQRIYKNPANHINILLVDLTNPKISVKTVLAKDKLGNLVKTSSMAERTGAIAAINGDYGSDHNPIPVPESIMMSDGELITSPKFRVALSITTDKQVDIFRFSNNNKWPARISSFFGGGRVHLIDSLNQPISGDSTMILYSDRWSGYSPGTSQGIPVTEILFRPNPRNDKYKDTMVMNQVLDYRVNQPGILIPKGTFLLSGKGESAYWLEKMFSWDSIKKEVINTDMNPMISLETQPSWKDYDQIIGGGPLIVYEAQVYPDPMMEFTTHLVPPPEDFPLDWKIFNYTEKISRSAVGITQDGKTLILVTVDGNRRNISTGFTRDELASFMISLGTWKAMSLDSGTSSSMVIKGKRVNKPGNPGKPKENKDIPEKEVVNALCIYYDKK